MSDAVKQRDLHLIVNYVGGRFNKCEFFSEKSEALDFGGINHTGCLSDFLPTKKMSELEVNKNYCDGRQKHQNQIQLEHPGGDRVEIHGIFPMRIAKVVGENLEQLTVMSDAVAEKRLQLHYLGGEFDRFEFCDKASA